MVGAGPVGLALAIQLARYGVPLRIIDVLSQPLQWSRAVAIQARTLELFERIGIADEFLNRGLRYREVVVHGERGRVTHESLTGIRSRYNFLLALQQNDTESILTERLRALGHEVERSTQLVHLEQDPGTVRVHLRSPSGERAAECSYLAGCDGAQSTVRHLVDAAFAGETISESFALADLQLDADLPRDAISMFVMQGTSVTVFPLPGERTRLVLARRDPFEVSPTLDDFRSALHAGGVTIRECTDPLWITRFTIAQRRVAHVQKERIFLLGDAAHVHSPLSGQGMNVGIQDAENLAWKLGLVMRHNVPASFLQSFGAEREPVAAKLARASRSRVPSFVESELVYERSPIVVAQGRTPEPRPGAQAPDGALARAAGNDERTSVFELISSLRHVLLIFTYRRDQFVHEMLMATQRHNEVVDTYLVARDPSVAGATLLDPPGAVFRAYGVEGEPQYILIRPDGYVAMRGAVRDGALLAAYLDRTFAAQPA